MKKEKEVEQIKQNPCIVCGKKEPMPYGRYHAGVVCSKGCDISWKQTERGKHARTLQT